VPAHAVEVAPGLFSLGEAIDPESGEAVEGYMIMHPRTNNKKPAGTPGGGGKNGGGGGGGDALSSCYSPLAKGARWKNTESWLFNADGSGIGQAEAYTIMEDATAQWNDATDGKLDGNVSFEVFGSGSSSAATLTMDETAPDGSNEAYFASIADPGVIGVTLVWGVFGGPPNGRYLSEWDQVYDNVDFTWATDGSSNDMDFASIATHELGHSLGLADIYDSTCALVTMYGYGSEGDTYARDLESGDLNGAAALY